MLRHLMVTELHMLSKFLDSNNLETKGYSWSSGNMISILQILQVQYTDIAVLYAAYNMLHIISFIMLSQVMLTAMNSTQGPQRQFENLSWTVCSGFIMLIPFDFINVPILSLIMRWICYKKSDLLSFIF